MHGLEVCRKPGNNSPLNVRVSPWSLDFLVHASKGSHHSPVYVSVGSILYHKITYFKKIFLTCKSKNHSGIPLRGPGKAVDCKKKPEGKIL